MPPRLRSRELECSSNFSVHTHCLSLDKMRILIQLVWVWGLRFCFSDKFPGECCWLLDQGGRRERELRPRSPAIGIVVLVPPGGQKLPSSTQPRKTDTISGVLTDFFPTARPLTSSFQPCNNLSTNLPRFLTLDS